MIDIHLGDPEVDKEKDTGSHLLPAHSGRYHPGHQRVVCSS